MLRLFPTLGIRPIGVSTVNRYTYIDCKLYRFSEILFRNTTQWRYSGYNLLWNKLVNWDNWVFYDRRRRHYVVE